MKLSGWCNNSAPPLGCMKLFRQRIILGNEYRSKAFCRTLSHQLKWYPLRCALFFLIQSFEKLEIEVTFYKSNTSTSVWKTIAKSFLLHQGGTKPSRRYHRLNSGMPCTEVHRVSGVSGFGLVPPKISDFSFKISNEYIVPMLDSKRVYMYGKHMHSICWLCILCCYS